jgi:alkylhydroperoxidase/carboxymuconolactone decarboxylase family protein YurZ
MIKMSKSPLELLEKNDPTLTKTRKKVYDLAFSEGDLPVKMKALIAMVLDAGFESEGGVRAFAQKAINYGATKKEVLEAIRVGYYICGVGVLYTASRGLDGVI